MSLLGALARLAPAEPEPTADLAVALRLLGRSDTATYRRAADGLAVTVGGVGLLATALAPTRLRPAVLLVAVALALGGREVALRGPKLAAGALRRRALGTAPWLVCRAAMRLRVTPTREAAAAFAARDPAGPLDRGLAASVRRARGTGDAGFGDFLDRWGDRFPPLRRGLRLLESAAEAPADERDRGIDRALDAVLAGVRERAAGDAAALRGPVTAVYAFGVLLPLAFVAALPATRVAGLPVSVPVVVAVYDLALPLGLLVASAWLVANRPVAFPATPVPRDHPDVPDAPWGALAAGVAVAACAWVVAPRLLPAWTPPVAAAGFGVGTALVFRFRPYREVRAEVRAVEEGLPDALYAVGRRVADGDPVETALVAAGAESDTPAAALLAEAADRGSALGVGVRDSLLGEHGAVGDLPSRRVADAARLFADAAREGRPAGPALVAAGEHLADLARVEREARRSVRHATGTIGNTAAVFGPLVGGVTVALAGRVGGSEFGEALPQGPLAVAVGGYVLLLAVLLTALATGLERGFDRALVGYRVGLALLAATATYLAAVVAGGLVA
ncbi:type II secretion system protein [Halosegnis marinus]|uniref:Type II secretion system protein n=1 Tax=Halosegnis marinus TaxID=3034023 RepID=A0ABD5ZQE0_9EURY|nr:type II secretion system protein [Halosegnis sp. DT85]